MEPAPHFEMNPSDCNRLKLDDGDEVRVVSETGSVTAPVKSNPDVQQGLVTTTFHSTKLPINTLFPTRFDRLTFTPNYRTIAVRVEKVKR
jgi:anaerobic selenocysteine-containing dehydrogenase